ncbi:DMT family transporter [Ectopseudomonas mendocina]|uniref:DMT family transporter n=1 Tax=Ectopseudomonas mendocina TaxID=300 RepID=A0ABZ2RCS3_ECTME
MTALVFTTILFAAALHASWNAIVKAGKDTFLTTVLVSAFAAIWALIGLPFLPVPDSQSWPYIFISTLLQVIYCYLLATVYRLADMSLVYPLMRGVAPIIVALTATHFLGEKLTGLTWLGILIVCSGVLFALVRMKSGNAKGVMLALLNAFIIAGYTLSDGIGVRLSGSPVAYTLWVFLLAGVLILIWPLVVQRRAFFAYTGQNWRLGAVGGMGAIASYGLALWAMIGAPVAVVAALRESSILFAALISFFILKERVDAVRVISACLIVVGVAVLRCAS